MRINKFLAQATGMSRRAADEAIKTGRVTINGQPAELGDDVNDKVFVRLDDRRLQLEQTTTTIMLNKPIGYVCSRTGQGSPTVYELLPPSYQSLKLVGRLDKDSSGLILLTNDGDLANELTHPRYAKTKVYEVSLDKPLQPLHQQMINDHGIELADGNSKLQLEKQDAAGQKLQVTMSEGRNRQIRRTFEALGYKIVSLHRISFGNYKLDTLASGHHQMLAS
jgi:pseudouridine synthase